MTKPQCSSCGSNLLPSEIKELKEQMKALVQAGKKGEAAKTDTIVDSTPYINEELESARTKYTEVFGKKPSHLMKLGSLNKKIAEKLAE